MKLLKATVACACCVFAGVSLIFGMDGLSENKSNRGSQREVFADESISELAQPNIAMDWRGYLEWWMTAGCPAKGQKNAREYLWRWAEVDADAALAFVHDAARFPGRNSAYAIPLAEIAKQTPSRVVAWVRKNLTQDDWSDVSWKVIERIRDTHPLCAAELARMEFFSPQSYWWTGILSSLTRRNPVEAVQMFEALPVEFKQGVAGDLAAAWTIVDFEAALDWCREQQGTAWDEQMRRSLLFRLKQEHPALAEKTTACLSYSPRDLRYVESALIAAGRGCGHLDRIESAQKIQENLARQFHENTEQIVAKLKVLPTSNQQAEHFVRGWLAWEWSDRKAAATWLAAQPDALLREYVRMAQLRRRDLVAFLASVDSSQDNAYTEKCITQAFCEAGFQRPNELLRWLTAHPGRITLFRLNQLSWDGAGSKNECECSTAILPNVEKMRPGPPREAVIAFLAWAFRSEGKTEQSEAVLKMIGTGSDSQQARRRVDILLKLMTHSYDTGAALIQLDKLSTSESERAVWKMIIGDRDMLWFAPPPLHPGFGK